MLGGKKSADRGVLPRGGANEASMSLIGPGMNIVGDLSTDGTVRVEGRIEGTVRAGKAVVIGKGGEVVGDVLTQDAVIGGTVRGTVVAESRLELQATCDIEGQIRARSQHLQLEEGCRFNGQIQMLDGGESLALPAPARVENSTES
ncbi:MAG TPA: polymer-forming cytoskeletal protein [Longimicrobium sp.]